MLQKNYIRSIFRMYTNITRTFLFFTIKNIPKITLCVKVIYRQQRSFLLHEKALSQFKNQSSLNCPVMVKGCHHYTYNYFTTLLCLTIFHFYNHCKLCVQSDDRLTDNLFYMFSKSFFCVQKSQL